MGTFLASPESGSTIRIQGPAGVGKSRLALEALSVLDLAKSAIYAVDAEFTQVQELLSDPASGGIVVVDECTMDRQEVLTRHTELLCPGVRLVCVGPSEKRLRSGVTQVYDVKPLPDADLRAVLLADDARLPPEIVATTIRVSGGYVKLARFVARNLALHNAPLAELHRFTGISEILTKIVPQSAREGLQVLSLLARVGWEDEVQVEAESIARSIGLPFVQLQKAVRDLREQGVVLPRGRYLYVSPDLLAVTAAAELWSERGPDLIRVIEDLPGPVPRRQFLLRLVMMAEHDMVNKAVVRLLGEDGLFRSVEDLDSEFLSEVFLALSVALPRAAVEALARVLDGTPRSRLLSFRSGRRNVIWALESLVRWPETSLEAARCLKLLALSENESFANNATGIFCQFFQLHLSGSPIPIAGRLRLLDDLIEAVDLTANELAVNAASAALTRREFRMGGDEESMSSRLFPPEWRPRNTQEVWDARRAAVACLQRLLGSGGAAAASALEKLIHSAEVLTRDGLADDAIELLECLQPKSMKHSKLKANTAYWILEHDTVEISPSQRARLAHLSSPDFGDDLMGALMRWAGPRLDLDYDSGPAFARADSQLLQLAETAYTQGLDDKVLSWLCTSEADNVWPFGKRLGELDTHRLFLDRIVQATPERDTCAFLVSYIGGLASVLGLNVWDEICGPLSQTRPVLAYQVICRGPATAASGRLVLGLIDAGKLPGEMMALLQYGGWAPSLPVPERRALIQRLLEREDPFGSESLSILSGWLESDSRSALEARDLMWAAIRAAPVKSAISMHRNWAGLAKALVPDEPTAVADLVIRRITCGSGWPHFNDIGKTVLAAALKVDPRGVFELVADATLESGHEAFRLLLALERWFGELVPTEIVVEWAQSRPPKARSVAARLITVEGVPMPARVRALFQAFPHDQSVVGSVLASLGSGSWWGEYSARLRKERDVVSTWATEADPTISKWLRDEVRRMDRAIAKQVMLEDEVAWLENAQARTDAAAA